MKTSRFHVVKTIGEKTWVYNTLVSSFIKLSTTQWNSLAQQDDKELISVLLQQGILVDENINEISKYKYFFYNKIFNKETLNVTIAPTMQCNFSCPYCFEGNNKNFSQMSEEIENRIVQFLIKQNEKKKITISWFGGEPLLAFNKILSISSKLDENNISYSASMITNGSLLREDIIKKLPTLHLTHIQISLDGVGEEHDQNRHYKNGRSSFDDICQNIEKLLELTDIKLYLQVGVDNSKPDSYRNVYFYIKEKFPKALATKQIEIGANVIKNRTNFDIKNKCFSKKQLFEKDLRELKDQIYENFSPGLPLLSSPCMYRLPYILAIDSKGYIYHCLEHLGQPSLSIGNITIGKLSSMKLSNMAFSADPFLDEECLHCNVLPICGGGCPIDRMKEKGKEKKSYCSYYKDYLADLLPYMYNKNNTKS